MNYLRTIPIGGISLRSIASVLLLFALSTVVFIPKMEAQDFLDMGMKLLQKKDLDKAIELFQRALERTPKSAKAHFYLGEAYYQKGAMDSAEMSFSSAVKYDDEYAAAYKRLGDIFSHQKRYADAIAQYNRALKYEAKNSEFLYALGVCYLEADSVDKAIVEFTKAREANPKDAMIYVGLGDAYLKLGVVPFSIEQYKKAVEQDSTLLITHQKLARLYIEQRMGREALRELEIITRLDSTNPAPWWEAGHLLYINERYDNALPFLKKFTELKPRSSKGHLEYGKALAKSKNKRYKDAIPELLEAIKLDTARAMQIEAWRQLADSYFWTKDYGKSDSAYSKLATLDTLNVNEYEKWGLSAHFTKDTTAAIKAYKNAVRLNSTLTEVYKNVFALLSAIGERDTAIVIFKRRIEVDSKSADESYYYMGTAYYTMEEFDSARVSLQKAVAIKDTLPYALWLARCYVALNDKARRRSAYEHVLKLAQQNNSNDHRKEIGEALGFIGMDQLLDATINNEWEKPVETLKRAIQYNPDLPSQADLHTWLGQSLMYLYFKRVKETGDRKGNDYLKQDACAEFNKVLKIDPKNPNAKNSKDKLDCP